MRISSETRSVYYDYKGPRTNLTFFRQVLGSEGKLIHQSVGSVNLTGVGNRPLLIFSAHPTTIGTYAVRPFSDNATDVKPGGYRFVNFTIRNIAMKFGQQKLIIPPNEQLVVNGETPESSSSNEVRMFGILLNDEVKAIYSSIWSYNPEIRTLVLISPTNSNALGVKIKCFSEHISQIPIDPESLKANHTP